MTNHLRVMTMLTPIPLRPFHLPDASSSGTYRCSQRIQAVTIAENMKRISAFALALLSVSVLVRGDVYMHMPRGSNDRNCERNVNRDNENR
jgi:hypothetical protein